MRPNPLDYDDYREYLRDMFAHCKVAERRFSHREFAKRAGFTSASVLKNVIDGKNNIAQPSVAKFAEGLSLTRGERESFEALVMYCQAETNAEKNHYLLALRDRANRIGVRPKALEDSQYEVYSCPIALPIREMMLLEGFSSEPAWIAAQFNWPVSEEEVITALKLLVSVGLIENENDGSWQPCEPTLSATPGKLSSAMRLGIQNHHRNMLSYASEALEGLEQSERSITSVTVSLGPTEYQYINEKIAELRSLVLQLGESPIESGSPRRIYNVGFQVVPITKSTDGLSLDTQADSEHDPS